MPVYDFVCHDCKVRTEVKLTFKEHDEKKNSLPCPQCGKVMIQKVAPLRFTLVGCGWFGSSETCADPYSITEMEVRQNLEGEKYVEEYATKYMEKDKLEEQRG